MIKNKKKEKSYSYTEDYDAFTINDISNVCVYNILNVCNCGYGYWCVFILDNLVCG